VGPARDRFAKLKNIELPVLVVNGKTDLMVPTVNSFILQQHLPNAELIIRLARVRSSHELGCRARCRTCVKGHPGRVYRIIIKSVSMIRRSG
jgi:hypothetical protein